jgi:hypothetical protein
MGKSLIWFCSLIQAYMLYKIYKLAYLRAQMWQTDENRKMKVVSFGHALTELSWNACPNEGHRSENATKSLDI